MFVSSVVGGLVLAGISPSGGSAHLVFMAILLGWGGMLGWDGILGWDGVGISWPCVLVRAS